MQKILESLLNVQKNLDVMKLMVKLIVVGT